MLPGLDLAYQVGRGNLCRRNYPQECIGRAQVDLANVQNLVWPIHPLGRLIIVHPDMA